MTRDALRHGPKILVVDDTADVAALFARVLTRAEYQVTVATSGPAAVAAADPDAGFVLVLLDVQMPELDGPATLAALRARIPGLRCAFVTGNPGDYSADDLLACGAEAIFPKPIRPDELVRRVTQLLAGDP